MKIICTLVLFLAFLSTNAQKVDTVYVSVDIPPTLEKNSIERAKKMQEIQVSFNELQEKYKELMKLNKDDLNILMEVGKIDSTKLFRDKNGNFLLSPKKGKLTFKLKL